MGEEGAMKIFITGGTGFIGGRLIKRLSLTGHELRCLVRETSRTGALEKIGVSLVRGDLTDKPSLLRGMQGCDWVINLAGVFEFWLPDRGRYHRVNVEGTRNVIEAALETRISKILHVSTVAVYGDAPWPIREDSPLGTHCASRYAQTKRSGDAVAWSFFERMHAPLVMVFPGAVLGSDDPKAAGRYVRNVMTGTLPAQIVTRSTFAWVYVDDVAEGILRALEREDNIGEKYLLVAENLTFGEINRMSAELAQVRLPRWTMPNWLTMANAHLATTLANVTRKPPILDLAVDQVRLMRQGFRADGSKAREELCLTYTPIRTALKEVAMSLPRLGA